MPIPKAMTAWGFGNAEWKPKNLRPLTDCLHSCQRTPIKALVIPVAVKIAFISLIHFHHIQPGHVNSAILSTLDSTWSVSFRLNRGNQLSASRLEAKPHSRILAGETSAAQARQGLALKPG